MPSAKFCARCMPEVTPPFSAPDHGPSSGTEKPMTDLAAFTRLLAYLFTADQAEPRPLANWLPRCEPLPYALHPLAPELAALARLEPLERAEPDAEPIPLAKLLPPLKPVLCMVPGVEETPAAALFAKAWAEPSTLPIPAESPEAMPEEPLEPRPCSVPGMESVFPMIPATKLPIELSGLPELPSIPFARPESQSSPMLWNTLEGLCESKPSRALSMVSCVRP